MNAHYTPQGYLSSMRQAPSYIPHMGIVSSMSALALALYLVYLAVAFWLRSVLHRRRTGSVGFRGVSGRPGSAEWSGGVLFAVATVAGLLAPVLALAGVVAPVEALVTTPAAVVGVALFLAGPVCAVLAQHAMGASWRIGVDAGERTDLVTHGVFAYVRNPFFTASAAVGAGLALLVPSVVAIAALAALLAAVELQVRVVEEPYLRRTHGRAYAAYAARAGRFLPGLGRLAI